MATKTPRTLKVTCPFCLDADATVKLDLNQLDACTWGHSSIGEKLYAKGH